MKKIIILLICLALLLVGCDTIGSGNSIRQVNPADENNNETIEENGSLPDEEETAKDSVKYVKSTVNSLSVRSAPSSFSDVFGYMDKEDMVAYAGEKDGYFITTYKERTAYVSSKYSEVVEFEKSSDDIEDVIAFASTLLGYPYIYGSQRYHWGNGVLNPNFENGKFDCSSLTQYVYFIAADVVLETTTRTQVYQGVSVSRENIKRGDLLFFTNSTRYYLSGNERIGHVAIYLGNNYILHTSSDFAVIEPISDARWNYYITARRML